MNETVQEIKRLFAKNNIPVFGIGKSSHLENDVLGYRPSDSLPSVESMLCLGVPFPKGVFQYWEVLIDTGYLTVFEQTKRLIETVGLELSTVD